MTTATEVISYEEILSDLKAIVEEFGADYVYVKPLNEKVCKYAHEDGPGCIVGQLLSRRGVTLEQLAGFDKRDCSGVDDLIYLTALPFSVDARTANLLSFVQVNQDRGNSWGESLIAAVHSIKLPQRNKLSLP